MGKFLETRNMKDKQLTMKKKGNGTLIGNKRIRCVDTNRDKEKGQAAMKSVNGRIFIWSGVE